MACVSVGYVEGPISLQTLPSGGKRWYTVIELASGSQQRGNVQKTHLIKGSGNIWLWVLSHLSCYNNTESCFFSSLQMFGPISMKSSFQNTRNSWVEWTSWAVPYLTKIMMEGLMCPKQPQCKQIVTHTHTFTLQASDVLTNTALLTRQGDWVHMIAVWRLSYSPSPAVPPCSSGTSGGCWVSVEVVGDNSVTPLFPLSQLVRACEPLEFNLHPTSSSSFYAPLSGWCIWRKLCVFM